MDYFTLGIGLFAMFFGTSTLILRFKHQEKLGKLNAMKDRYGPTTGVIIHTISYTVVPLVAGVILVIAGLRGGSIFGSQP